MEGTQGALRSGRRSGARLAGGHPEHEPHGRPGGDRHAYAKDEAAARAEYGAQFRTDIETFLSREIVEACIEAGCSSRPPRPDLQYVAFVDPSGGVGDSFALAIAHAEGDDVVLDLVHERRAPLSPEAAVEEFVSLLKPYRVRRSSATGTRRN